MDARPLPFSRLLWAAFVLLTVGVGLLVLVGVLSKLSLPMCTSGFPVKCVNGTPDSQPWDVALVALIGAIAAGFSALASIPTLGQPVDPYRSPLAQGMLKMPTGAFTAVLGVLAIEQGLQATAGVTASQGGILFLAFVFGYSQQLVTRLVDAYGSRIRDGLPGQRAAGGTEAGLAAVR